MNYFILRDGQEFGPYTLGDLQRYVASGNILPTDMAKSEGMTEPMMVSQIMGTIAVPPQNQPAQYAQPGQPGQYAQPLAAAVPGGAFYPDPPNLNWGLVLLFSFLTCGLFGAVWALIEASWMKKVAPQSKALGYYIGATVLLGIIFFASMGLAIAHSSNQAASILNIVYAVIAIVARFSLKASLEEHYNTVEPIGLHLNGVMVFFFGEIYFQYHFNEINKRKAMSRMGLAAY